jgi:hypothetical protein
MGDFLQHPFGDKLFFKREMITTVQTHILAQQQRTPGARGTFSWLLSGITLATKMTEARIRPGEE